MKPTIVFRIAALVAAFLLAASPALAQTYPGQIGAGHVLGNSLASSAPAVDTTPTSLFDQFYCSTVGQLLVRFTGAWTCSPAIAGNPVWWGADPTGAADSTSAINSAMTATGNNVQFSPGTYKVNSALSYTVTAGKTASFRGAGQGITILTFPNATNGVAFSMSSSASSVQVRNLTLLTQQANASGTGLAITNSVCQGAPPTTLLDNLYISADVPNGSHYWANAISLSDVTNTNIQSVTIFGDSGLHGNGITTQGTASNCLGTILNVWGAWIQFVQNGVQFGNFFQGLTVGQSNIVGCVNGINVGAGLSATALSELNIVNNNLNCTSNGADILTSTVVNGVQIVGNLITGNTSTSGVVLSQYNSVVLSDNLLYGNANGSGVGIQLGTATAGAAALQANVNNNMVQNWGVGINILSGATHANIHDNDVSANNTTPLGNAASSQTTLFIRNNAGYNPIGLASQTPGTSPWTFTNGSSPAMIMVNGGTFSAATAGYGTNPQVCTGTVPCAVYLEPHEQFVLTYTVAPTVQTITY